MSGNRQKKRRAHHRLSAGEARFVEAMLVAVGRHGQKDAAIRAGYSPKAASVAACKLLARPRVAAELARRRQALAEKTDITAERIDQELARIAFADLRACFDEQGRLKAVNQLPEHVAAALAGVEVVTRPGTGGEVEYVHRIKAWPKPQTLELLCRRLGLLVDKGEVLHRVSLVDLLSEPLK